MTSGSGTSAGRGGRVPHRVTHVVGGVVGVRLVDPSPGDARAVERLLGPAADQEGGPGSGNGPEPGPTPVADDPDVEVRFADRLVDGPTSDALSLVEGGRTASDGDALYLLSSAAGNPVARLRPGDDAGPRGGDDAGTWELDCLRGRGSVPLLRELVDLAALRRGWVPLHASAWVHEGRGVLAAGWDRSGKTGTLLAFAEQGAEFVGDDRIYLARDGGAMFGLPARFRVRGWHVAELPGLASRFGPGLRLLGGLGRRLASLEARLPAAGSGGGVVGRVARKAVGRLRKRISEDVSPAALFGEDRCPGKGVPDAVFLLLTHRKDTVEVEATDPRDLAGRLAATVAAELRPLRRIHLATRFAFPDHRWPLLERAEELAAEQLTEALAGKPAFLVRHPYPCSLPGLYREMEGVLPPRGGRPSEEGTGIRRASA